MAAGTAAGTVAHLGHTRAFIRWADGVLDRLSADACDAGVQALARAADLQTIVVSNDPNVVQRIRNVGGGVVRWPTTGIPQPDPAWFTG